MPDHSKCIRPAEQPIRSSFLCHIEAEAAETVRQFADLLESALHEAFTAPVDRMPFNLALARATVEDLEALLRHQREVVEGWDRETQDDTSLQRAMLKTLDALQEIHATLLIAVEAEEARLEG